MGLGDMLKNAAKVGIYVGNVSGSSFPNETKITMTTEDKFSSMTFVLPDKTEYVVTHDKVNSAEILVLGYIEGGQSPLLGIKYKIQLDDGKTAILTIQLAHTLKVEHVIF